MLSATNILSNIYRRCISILSRGVPIITWCLCHINVCRSDSSLACSRNLQQTAHLRQPSCEWIFTWKGCSVLIILFYASLSSVAGEEIPHAQFVCQRAMKWQYCSGTRVRLLCINELAWCHSAHNLTHQKPLCPLWHCCLLFSGWHKQKFASIFGKIKGFLSKTFNTIALK